VTYHFRISAANGSGTSKGSDGSFTTPSAPPPPAVQLVAPVASSKVGTSFTITATVTEAGVPRAAVPVSFKVTGANPRTSSSTSDAGGRASFSYTGTNTGVDHIVATFIDKAGQAVVSNEVTTTWATAEVRTFKLSAPILGKTVNVEVISGQVFVKLPPGSAASNSAAASLHKGAGFIPLSEARQIPVGSILDTSAGVAKLTSATTTGTQFGDFTAGLFEVLQARKQRGLTELDIVNSASSRALCATTGKGAAISRRRLTKRLLGTLHGEAHGKFTTRGEFSSATVRGTIWSVSNRCDGTLTAVRRGVVSVRDFARRRTIVLHAGRTYLARRR
jgi:hypothetical protein